MQADTFLVAVYCVVDDLYRAQWAALKPIRPGPRPEMSDSEVLTLMVLAQWHPSRSEQDFLVYVGNHWQAYFPRLLSQSSFNRRSRDLWGVLCQLGPAVSQATQTLLQQGRTYEAMDSVPVPLMCRCRGERHRVFGAEAGIGYGGSDRDWYYGVKLLASVNPLTQITGFVIGPGNTADQWLAEGLLRWRRYPLAAAPTAADLEDVLAPPHRGPRVGPTGPMAPRLGAGAAAALDLADLGFRGTAWKRHWQEAYGVTVCTPHDLARGQHRWFSRLRHVVERTFSSLVGSLGLRFPGARSYRGLLTPIAAKVAGHNLMVHLNLWAGEKLETRPQLFV